MTASRSRASGRGDRGQVSARQSRARRLVVVNDGYALRGPLALARSAVDRAAHLRDDTEQLELRWRDPATRVAVVADGRIAVVDGAVAFVPPQQAPRGERYLLGTDGSVTYMAVHADEPEVVATVGQALPGSGAAALTLRDVGTVLDDRDAGLAVHALALANWHATHRYCPRCGSATEVAAAGHVRRCQQDGSEHYPRVDPAVIMLVTDADERCLLGRQRRWPPRRYSTLAGFVEPGETPERAVAREVWEEVGVVVSSCAYAGSQPWPFPSSLMLGYYAMAEGTSPRPDGEEIVEAQWFSRAELAAALRGGDIRLPPPVSIARRLVEGWYGAELPD